MKTELLKKLRKKAKSFYWIEYWPQLYKGCYVIRNKHHKKNEYDLLSETKDLSIAKEKIDQLRRRFILEKVWDKARMIGKNKIDY